MKIGIAISPRSAADWVELSLSVIPDVGVEIVDPSASAPSYDLLLIDSDNPGPGFLSWHRQWVKQKPEGFLLVLGSPAAPLLMNMEWETERTVFIAKPYQLEALRDAVAERVKKLASEAPVVSTAPVPAGKAQNLGYLSTLLFSDLLQMLCLNRWTGKILVKNLASGEEGEAYLNVGVLIHARQGAREAESACYEMLKWGRCEFNFVEDMAPVIQTIQTHWQEVIIEGARRLDENAAAGG